MLTFLQSFSSLSNQEVKPSGDGQRGKGFRAGRMGERLKKYKSVVNRWSQIWGVWHRG